MTEKELIKNSIERYAPDPAGFSAEETVNRAKNRARVRPHRSWAVAAVTAAAAAAVGFALFLWSKSDMRVTPGEEQDNSAAEIVTSAPDSSPDITIDNGSDTGVILLDLKDLSEEERKDFSREFTYKDLPEWKFTLTGKTLRGARYLVNNDVPTESCTLFSGIGYTVSKVGFRDVTGDGSPEILLECYRRDANQAGSMVTVIDVVKKSRRQYYVPNMMSCSLAMQDGLLMIRQERQQPYSKMYLIKDVFGYNGLTLGGYNNESDAVTYFDPAGGREMSPEYKNAMRNKYIYSVYHLMQLQRSEVYHYGYNISETVRVGEGSADTVTFDNSLSGGGAPKDPKAMDFIAGLTSPDMYSAIEPVMLTYHIKENTVTADEDPADDFAGSYRGSVWLSRDGFGSVTYTMHSPDTRITLIPPENEETMDQFIFRIGTDDPIEPEQFIPETPLNCLSQNSLFTRSYPLLTLIPEEKRVFSTYDGKLKIRYSILLEDTEEGSTEQNPSGKHYVFRVDSIENNTDIPTEKLRLSYSISSPGDNSGETELKEGLELVLSSAAKPAKSIYMRILSDSWEDSIMSLNIVVSD